MSSGWTQASARVAPQWMAIEAAPGVEPEPEDTSFAERALHPERHAAVRTLGPIRTGGLQVRNLVLYPLSYEGMAWEQQVTILLRTVLQTARKPLPLLPWVDRPELNRHLWSHIPALYR